ncbi:MAG: hypothetical protein ACRC9T_09660 [Vibrionaceae bacterium]
MKLSRCKQKGIAVLWVVVSIVTLTALFIFTTVSVTRDSVKKVQNHIQNERAQSSLQSALLCAATTFETLLIAPDFDELNSGSSVFSPCKLSSAITFSLSLKGTDWLLSASNGFLTRGVLLSPRTAPISSFNSAGSLSFDYGTVGADWTAAPGAPIKDSEGQDYFVCSMINLQGSLMYNGKNSPNPLRNGNESCISDYRSDVTYSSDKFQKDVTVNANDQLLFELVFNTEKSNWLQVKNSFDTVLVTDTGEKVQACGKDIKAAIDAGSKAVWVQGNCLLDGLEEEWPDLSEQALVVIQDGVFAGDEYGSGVTAGLPEKAFNVSIYQFITSPSSTLKFDADWGWKSKSCGSTSTNPLYSICNKVPSSARTQFSSLPFYFPYSVAFTGSLMIDVPNSNSLIPWYSSIGYDRNLAQLPQGGSYVIKKGSFHDMQ